MSQYGVSRSAIETAVERYKHVIWLSGLDFELQGLFGVIQSQVFIPFHNRRWNIDSLPSWCLWIWYGFLRTLILKTIVSIFLDYLPLYILQSYQAPCCCRHYLRIKFLCLFFVPGIIKYCTKRLVSYLIKMLKVEWEELLIILTLRKFIQMESLYNFWCVNER